MYFKGLVQRGSHSIFMANKAVQFKPEQNISLSSITCTSLGISESVSAPGKADHSKGCQFLGPDSSRYCYLSS